MVDNRFGSKGRLPHGGRLSRPGYYRLLYVGALGESECVFDIDAEVANRAWILGVTQRDLDRSEIAGGLVDGRCLCPP